MPDEKIALITGASSGIGAALAALAAADGYHLILIARSQERLKSLAEELVATHGAQSTVLAYDLTVPESADAIAAQLATLGYVPELLINNAGFGLTGPFATTAAHTELAMLQLNIVALTRVTKLLLPGMLARGSGRIMQVASTAAFQPGPMMAVYYASKAYVLSFTEALACELKGSGITVTALCPGPTRTNFQAKADMPSAQLFRLLRMMDADAVARIGYRGMLQGRTIVIPGLINALIAFLIRLTPRAMVTGAVRRLHGM